MTSPLVVAITLAGHYDVPLVDSLTIGGHDNKQWS